METMTTGAYFGEVLGLIDGHEDRGPIFRVPVTVVKVCTIHSFICSLYSFAILTLAPLG